MTKHLARVNGVPVHDALYTLVNEYEEIRGQALTLTKSLSYIQGMISGISEGLKIHGYPPTEYMWTDNAKGKLISLCCRLSSYLHTAELQFHESATPSLALNVHHIEADTYSNLPKIDIPNGFMTISYNESERDLIDDACLNIMRQIPESGKLFVGFHIEYNGSSNKIDVIVLCTCNTIYTFKV